MLKFLEKQDVKLVAIACNTISTMVDKLRDKFDFPIIDIITPTVDHIEKMGIKTLLILGTEFTIKTKAYEKLLCKRDEKYEVYSESSPNLATLVDSGKFHSPELYSTIRGHIDSINGKGNIYNVVLACTHYPIVEDVFMEIEPTFNYINPGLQQAKAIRMELHKRNNLNKNKIGSLKIFTSGDIEIYNLASEKLDIQNIKSIESINIPSYNGD
jgi:glutamate racemase